ncbi:esterase/lipase family protein [Blastococcus sp. SYSU DS0533]
MSTDTAPPGSDAAIGLLVYVPGLATASRSAELLRQVGADLGPGWQVRVWPHGLTPLGSQRMEDAAHRLAVQVRTWAGDNGAGRPVDRILLVGHSLGGLLVRHAFLLDAGLAGAGSAAHPWTSKVARMVLLAAPNAGFRTSRLPLVMRGPYALAAAVGRLTAEDLQWGSPYLTELRLRWVNAFRTPAPPAVLVVQVLGDRDDLVTREDSLDIEYMAGAMRIDVPGADHSSLVDVTDDPERYGILRHALLGELDTELLRAEDTSDAPVYVVLHGIRTSRYATWVGELTSRLSRPVAEPGSRPPVVWAPSYGYFSAIDFALPFTRSRNLRRFLEWYGQVHVVHHGSPRHFTGHSNGTYLLGRALVAVPALYFDRIYLAGSVLPREYPWTEVVGRGQVTDLVLNDRATHDMPVGWLCAALRGLGMRDVGTAGVDGFDDRPARVVEQPGAYRGNHGAALQPDVLPHVSDFLVDGRRGPDPGGVSPYWFGLVGRLAGLLSAPMAVGGAVLLARWARPWGGRSRVAAASVGVAVAWAIGRAV